MMYRLICVFAGHTDSTEGFVIAWLIYQMLYSSNIHVEDEYYFVLCCNTLPQRQIYSYEVL